MNIVQLYQLYRETYLVDTDTRKIRKGSIFFALKGDNFNGNEFAEEALKSGANYVVIDEEKYKNAGLDKKTQMGFIAQELEEALPGITNDTELSLDFPTYTKKQLEKNPSLKNEQGKTMPIKAVNYDQLIPLLTQAIKEQQVIIEKQQEKIQSLEERLLKLETMFTKE